MNRRLGAAAALTVLVTASACGHSPSAAPRTSSTTSPDPTAPTATSVTTAAGEASSSTRRTSTTAARAGGHTTTTASAGEGGASHGAGPAPATAGTYRERQSGTSTAGATTKPVPSEGTLRVDAAKADGTQVWHRAVDPAQAPSDTTLSFRPDGMFIVSTITRASGGGASVSFTCTFEPPVPSPPWPPSVGATFGGHGQCQSFTADVSGRITGTRQVTLDGSPITVFVAESDLVTHGQVESTGHEVDWFSPALRLVVHNESQAKGTYGVVSFASNVTSDLVSGRPS